MNEQVPKKHGWPYGVLFFFIISWTSAMIIFVGDNFAAHNDIIWLIYGLLKVGQFVAVMVMFPYFEAYVNRDYHNYKKLNNNMPS